MSSEEISHILQRLTSIEAKQDSMSESLNQMKIGIGQRVETQGVEVAVLKDRMDSVSKILWGVFSVICIGVIGALLKTILVK